MSNDKKHKLSFSKIIRKLEGERDEHASPHQRGENSGSNVDMNNPLKSRSFEAPPHMLPEQPRFGVNPHERESPAATFVDTGIAAPPNASHAASNAAAPVFADTIAPPPKGRLGQRETLSGQFDDEDEEFDIYRYLGIVLRRKMIIIISTVLVGLFALHSFVNRDKYFVARARMLFNPSYQELVNDGSIPWELFGNREKKINTHLDLLGSNREVFKRVAKELGLDYSPEAFRNFLTIKKGGDSDNSTDIIEIICEHEDAATARNIANSLCNTYIDYIQEVNAQDITRMILKFDRQIEKVREDLHRKEDALRHFKENHGMYQLSSEANLVVQKLSNMELALQRTQLSMLDNKERFTAIRRQIIELDSNILQSITFTNPYENLLTDLEFQRNILLAEYNPDHFKVKNIEKQIDRVKEVLEEDLSKVARSKTYVKNPIRERLLQSLVTMTIDKASLEAKKAAQEKIIEQYGGELLDLPSLEQQLVNLQRETEGLVSSLTLLKGQYEKAKIKRDSQESDLKILEPARLPKAPVSKVNKQRIYIGILVGLILGIAVAFLIEYLDQTIKDPKEVEKVLELPLLGIVPYIEGDKAIIDMQGKKSKSKLEPFRALRTNLKHLASVHHIRSLIICSPVKGEGKTTLAANLAITFAMDNIRVILIDGDLRRPQIHALFDMNKQIGFSDYIMGSAEINEIIKETPYENLHVVTSGERPHNPTELLGTVRFDKMIEELKANADLLIFDSPALLPVSDAMAMAPKMDSCVIVARTLWTPLKAARQAKAQLKQIGTNVMGTILNGISHSRGYYPYYYGYYRYYSYKYSYDYDEEPRKKRTIREFGLSAESKLKEALQTARFGIPRMMAAIGKSLTYVFTRKTFWLLVFALLAVSMFVSVKLAGLSPEFITGIEFVGSSAPATHVTDAEFIAGESGSKPLESFASTPGEDQGRIGRAHMNGNEMKLRDSLHFTGSFAAWQAALLARDDEKVISSYDRQKFKSPQGDFMLWYAENFEKLMQGEVHVDTSWSDAYQHNYRKASTLLSIVTGKNDTVSIRCEQIWVSTGIDWKIVGEKHLRLETR
ncbi:MAG: polysaccharide biosynthesis tyrosine autokinase [Chitinivibrionales bacterium]|nr:polysaccharide biosynthesis tyrosine autokinase [Chitinivibrionales bacterium]